MKFTFIEARKVCDRLDRMEGEDAASLSAVLRACIDAAECTNGLEMAMGIGLYKDEFCAQALDSLLTDLVPVIAKAVDGLDNLKYYINLENTDDVHV